MKAADSKFEILPETPAKFAFNIEGHGHMQFVTEHLTENDCALLVKNGCSYVKEKGKATVTK